jgi:hypothetical protein
MQLKNMFKKALRKIHRPAHPDIFEDFAGEIESLRQLGKFGYSIISSRSSPELNGNLSISSRESGGAEILIKLTEDFATGSTRYTYTDFRIVPPASQEFAATDQADLARLRKLVVDYLHAAPPPKEPAAPSYIKPSKP